MWELDNQTRFVADRTVVVDKTGERHLAVVIKGTFDIKPNGTTEFAENQVEVKIGPEYRHGDGDSSLLYEQELIAGKPGTDVYVNASAYAPKGVPTTAVEASLQTPFGFSTVLVTGDRKWERNLVGLVEPSAPQPFATMPIIYERAFGGYDRHDPDVSKHRMDPKNPVGTGFFTSASHKLGQAMPNIQWGGQSRAPGPAGFGAVCSYWEPRIKYQGTYDAKWLEQQKPLLPVDFDPWWFMCAPVAQQSRTYLRGGESFGLTNMTPNGVLTFQLPKFAFRLTTFIGRTEHEHVAKVNTVIIEPDFPRVLVLWHSTLSCHHDIDDIDRMRIREKSYI